MFEDGDFDIPSVYMKDTEGEKLLSCAGKTVDLISKAERIPSTAFIVDYERTAECALGIEELVRKLCQRKPVGEA